MPISRRSFLTTSAAAAVAATASVRAQTAPAAATAPAAQPSTGAEDRQYWLSVVDRLARPILTALNEDRLEQLLRSRKNSRPDRVSFACLEALGRLLVGIAPFLETGSPDGPEGKLRDELRTLARNGITRAVDPKSPSFMNFNRSSQPLVDTAFLGHAVLRAPTELWQKLDDATKKNFAAAAKLSRTIKPGQSNWLLFSAMVEAFLAHAGETILPDPVETALAKHESWYKGDGAYGDGEFFHFDFYNSFVIHPMMIDVVEKLGPQKPEWDKRKPAILKRAQRYAAVQERMISPEGTYPVIGRSLIYRYGAFQLLSQIALRHELPAPLKPAQVRCALTAVIKRISEFPNTFDDAGVLSIGIAGAQPALAETYISPGSSYLCSAGLLALGLPPTDPFWSAPPADWTSKLVFSGQASPIDHAVD